MGGCTKLFATWDVRLESQDSPDGRPIVSPLDADKCRESSAGVAAGIAHTKNVKLENSVAKCFGLTSDSGGGGNTESGGKEIFERGVLIENYLVGNCCMHNINLEGSRPMKSFMMGSAKQKEKADDVEPTVEQLLYSSYAWEAEIGLSCMKEFWDASAEHCLSCDFDDEALLDIVDDDEGSLSAFDQSTQTEDVLNLFRENNT